VTGAAAAAAAAWDAYRYAQALADAARELSPDVYPGAAERAQIFQREADACHRRSLEADAASGTELEAEADASPF
jgi:hypothetical protein